MVPLDQRGNRGGPVEFLVHTLAPPVPGGPAGILGFGFRSRAR